MLLRSIFVFAMGAFVSGCAIVMSAKLPLSRPPAEITKGRPQHEIDGVYGYPVAVGMSADGKEYVEQLQFIDGVSTGWKVFRICAHVICDDLTIFLWEFIGTPIEVMNANYPEYVYYVVYDDHDRVVRAVPQDSEEGRRLASLPWSVARLPAQRTNRAQTVPRMTVAERRNVANKHIRDKECMIERLNGESEVMMVTDGSPSVSDDFNVKVDQLRRLRQDGVITDAQFKSMVLRAVKKKGTYNEH